MLRVNDRGELDVPGWAVCLVWLAVLAQAVALFWPSLAAAQTLDDAVTGGYSPVASRYQWGSTGGDWVVPTGLTVLADCDGDALHSETACSTGAAWTVTGAPALVPSYWRPAGGSLQANAIRLAGGDSVASPALTYGSYCVRGATAAGVADVTCYTGGSGAITLSARDVQRVIVFAETLTAGQITAIQASSFARQGSLGEPLTVTRASSKSCSIGGAWFTVPAGQPCIGDAGLSVEGQRTQYALANCTAPADQTVTLAAGAHTLWMEGSGSVAAAVGTATATGLPCTATSASACSFTVSVGGTVTLDVEGTVALFQVENGARSSLICATTTPVTRQADVVSGAHGIASGGRFCVGGAVDPKGVWNTGARRYLFATTHGAVGSINLYVSNLGVLTAPIYQNATTYKLFSLGSAFAGSTPKRLMLCADGIGGASISVDGVSQPLTITGTGTGIVANPASTLYIGTASTGEDVSGVAFSNVVSCNTSIPEDCL